MKTTCFTHSVRSRRVVEGSACWVDSISIEVQRGLNAVFENNLGVLVVEFILYSSALLFMTMTAISTFLYSRYQ